MVTEWCSSYRAWCWARPPRRLVTRFTSLSKIRPRCESFCGVVRTIHTAPLICPWDEFWGALFLQPVKHRWACPEHIMANPNPNSNIYTATYVWRVAEILSGVLAQRQQWCVDLPRRRLLRSSLTDALLRLFGTYYRKLLLIVTLLLCLSLG